MKGKEDSIVLYSLVFGLVTLGFGVVPKIVRPKEINSWYGYRSVLSTKNNDTWKEANTYSSNQYIIAGIILLIIGRIAYAIIGPRGWIVSLIAFVPVLMCTVFTTEKHLKKIFNEDGTRINKLNRSHKKNI